MAPPDVEHDAAAVDCPVASCDVVRDDKSTALLDSDDDDGDGDGDGVAAEGGAVQVVRRVAAANAISNERGPVMRVEKRREEDDVKTEDEGEGREKASAGVGAIAPTSVAAPGADDDGVEDVAKTEIVPKKVASAADVGDTAKEEGGEKTTKDRNAAGPRRNIEVKPSDERAETAAADAGEEIAKTTEKESETGSAGVKRDRENYDGAEARVEAVAGAKSGRRIGDERKSGDAPQKDESPQQIAKEEGGAPAATLMSTPPKKKYPALCYVCERKFASARMLRKHEAGSDLHRSNLAALEARKRERRKLKKDRRRRRRRPRKGEILRKNGDQGCRGDTFGADRQSGGEGTGIAAPVEDAAAASSTGRSRPPSANLTSTSTLTGKRRGNAVDDYAADAGVDDDVITESNRRRDESGASAEAGPVRAWRCGSSLCSRAFDSYETAFEHQTQCSGGAAAADASPSPAQPPEGDRGSPSQSWRTDSLGRKKHKRNDYGGRYARKQRQENYRRRKEKEVKEAAARMAADADKSEEGGTESGKKQRLSSEEASIDYVDDASENFVIGSGPGGNEGYEFSLAVPGEDGARLSAISSYLRESCVEAFVITQDDIDAMRDARGRVHAKASILEVGQVGLRCLFCGSGAAAAAGDDGDGDDDDDDGERKPLVASHQVPGAVSFPTSTRFVFESTQRIFRRHLHACESAPLSVKSTLRRLQESSGGDRKGSRPRDYCHDAALRVGVVNTRGGVRLDRSKHEKWFEYLDRIEDSGAAEEEDDEGDDDGEVNGDDRQRRKASSKSSSLLPARSILNSGLPPLSSPSDSEHMSELHLFVRSSLQLFVVRDEDEAAFFRDVAPSRYVGASSLVPGQVGLTCRHCYDPATGRGRYRFPENLHDLYDQARTYVYDHYKQGRCTGLTPEMKSEFDEAMQLNGRGKNMNARGQYRRTALEIGLHDLPGEAAGLGYAPRDEIASDESDNQDDGDAPPPLSSLIKPSEYDMTTPFKRLLYTHLDVVVHDPDVSQSKVPPGTMGLACSHCPHGRRRYFATALSTWYQSTLLKFQAHLLTECENITFEERAALRRLKDKTATSDARSLSQDNKELHVRLWNRMLRYGDGEGRDVDEDEESSSGGEEEEEEESSESEADEDGRRAGGERPRRRHG